MASTTYKPEKPIPERKGIGGIPEGLPPEEVERLQKLQAKLTDFILHLVQAFLRTGYYTPDHPESKKAKEGLYQLFRTLFAGDQELTFLVREEQEKQEIFVEGLMPEAQRLSRMMIKGMGELYVPKFAKYLERKDLISLSLKGRMSQHEFAQFIDIMSDPSMVDTRRKQDKERFAQALYSRGIFSISFIFNEELLAPDREMPWRARLTLSRMKKDLKLTPHFQKMGGQELQDIRKHLLHDALRGVRQSDLLSAILRNSDLASSAETQEDFLENEILAFLQKQFLLATAKLFLRDHLTLKKLNKGDAFERKSDRLVKKISKRLRMAQTPETENLLEEFFRQKLVTMEDLTPRLKDKIYLEKLTDKFLDYTEQFFQQLDQAKDKESFLNTANSFVKVIPELIRRDRYPGVFSIIETLKRHFHKKTMWALLAGQIMEEIGTGPIPTMLEEEFLAGKKEVRTQIISIFVALEIGAIPHLLNILRKSEDQWVRKNACEALIQIGPVAALHLLKELDQKQPSVETACDILRVLGEIKSEQWKGPLLKLLRGYASHEHPKLREQALHAYCQIGGPEVEELSLSCFDDPDWEVRKRAVWCLGMVKSVKGAEKMMAILGQIPQTPSPQIEQLEAQIYRAFGIAGNLTIGGKMLEQTLLGILQKRGPKEWWNPFQKDLLSESSLSTICESLGKIGTNDSIKMLTKLGNGREGAWVPKAKEALKKIEERKRPQKA